LILLINVDVSAYVREYSQTSQVLLQQLGCGGIKLWLTLTVPAYVFLIQSVFSPTLN